MTSIAHVHDTGAATSSSSLQNAQVDQATGAVNGNSVDTIPAGGQELGSAQVYCSADANGNLAAAETATLAVTLQDAADDGTGSPAAFADVAADVLMGAADGADGLPTNPVISLEGGATEAATFTFNVPCQRLRRHFRLVSTWTFSDAGDTVDYSASSHAGGNVITPVE